jgi:uncharacterized membrane protein YphA (DoxX/SURF4 family)
MPPWKNLVSHVLAFGMAAIFIVAGAWKALDHFRAAQFMEQMKVPYQLSSALVLALAILETTAGVLILVPRFRRWGALLTSLLLIAFMGWVGFYYSELYGQDCSCFPWVERTVNPWFFVVDGLWLGAAALAGWWAKPSTSRRSALVVLGAVAVFAGVSYGVALVQQSGAKAPESIVVDGQPFSLEKGRYFIFFYDPECSHCDAAARGMSKLNWKSDVTVIAVPTRVQQFAAAFLRDTQLKAVTSLEVDKLKQAFPFGDPPYGVAIENGRMKGPVPRYEDAEPAATLRTLGYIE